MQREHSPDKIRAALACILADDREVWVRMGMALKHEFGEDGWDLFNEWSETASNYDATAAAATWKSCKASGGVSIGTLLQVAMRAGFDPKRFNDPAPLSDDEKKARQEARRQREDQARTALADKQRQAAANAEAQWAEAKEAGTSAYLTRKQVGAHGVRFSKGRVLVPVRDAEGNLWNLQQIYGKPLSGGNDKVFLAGGRVSGCFHLVGSMADPAGWLLVAEGYATAATLHEATGLPVVAAFNAANLRHVAEGLRHRYPKARLLVCADDDSATEVETGKNPGLVAAKDAARRSCAAMVKPEGLPEGASDFNDLACASGAELVRRQIEAAMRSSESVLASAAANGAAGATAAPASVSSNAAGGEGTPAPESPAKGRKSSRKPGQDRKPWFDVDDDGVWYHGYSDQGDPLPPSWVCSRLEITAGTRDGDNEDWGWLVEFSDPDGNPKQWVIAKRMVSGDGNEYRSALLSMGLDIASSARAKSLLTTYIQQSGRHVKARVRCVERVGWHDGAFVLPRRTIGDEGSERVLYQSGGAVASQFKQRGTLAEWRDNVAGLCVGNSRLMFCASVAFAGPLLYHSGQHSGGFHLVGDSSSGKTTGLRVAASVFGGHDYTRSWRATDNSLELTAAQHSDTLLILDEIAQVDPKIIGDTVYMLANEAGKGRATRTATARPALAWRLLFLSDGEIKLADHMAAAGKAAKSGQEIRLANIPADAGKGLGVFESLHGFASGKSLSDHLQAVTRTHYGTAGIAFIEWAVANINDLADMLREGIAELVREWVPLDENGQVQRVASRFALVAVAGELATHAGLTSWPKGESTAAARACFDAWLNERGGGGSSEHRTMVRRVRAFIEAHGSSRFSWVARTADDHAPNTMNRAGFRRIVSGDGTPIDSHADYQRKFGDKMSPTEAEDSVCEYFILPEVFRDEVCKGYDHKAVARLLATMGVLKHDSGRLDKRQRIAGMGRPYVYHITAEILEMDL